MFHFEIKWTVNLDYKQLMETIHDYVWSEDEDEE
jgi:hypothetical protein